MLCIIMDAEINKKSLIYHHTTVDATRTAYAAACRVGQKRTLDDVQRQQVEPTTAVLAAVTSRSSFCRPSVQETTDCYPELKASEIHETVSQVQTIQAEYSQRRNLALTPTPTSNPLLNLSHPAYSLPPSLVRNFASLGIKSIYPWQSECLLRSGALAGNQNLVYTAPTGGGKSLVADILMLKKVIGTPEKKAVLVLPYVALVQEKIRWLRKVVEGVSKTSTTSSPTSHDAHQQPIRRTRGNEGTVRVMGFFGGSKTAATWADMDIAVCTIEKVCVIRR